MLFFYYSHLGGYGGTDREHAIIKLGGKVFRSEGFGIGGVEGRKWGGVILQKFEGGFFFCPDFDYLPCIGQGIPLGWSKKAGQ